MITAFHRLPDFAALALVVVVLSGAAILASVVGAKILHSRRSEAWDEAAFDAYKALMATAGVVLAFSLVQVTTSLHSLQESVGREAANLSTVDRTLLRFGTPESVAVRPLVADFAQSLVRDEWPALSRSDRSARADAAYMALSKTARRLQPVDGRQQAMFAELLKALDDLSDTREGIVESADEALPDLYWMVTGGFIGLALLLAFATRPSAIRFAGLGSAAAGVGLLLAFVMVVDQPLRGQTRVSSAPIQKVIKANARRV